jgi:hypothetical protein
MTGCDKTREMMKNDDAKLDLYAKLAEAEEQEEKDDTGEDFVEFAERMREKITGKIEP